MVLRSVWRVQLTKIQCLPTNYITAVIVGVKVHVKRIHVAVTLVVYDDCRGHSSVRLPFAVRLGAFDPFRVLSHVVVGSEPHIGAHLVDVG